MAAPADRHLWEAVDSYVTAERLELYDLEVLGQGPGTIVRVTVEGTDLGVDRIADLSRGLSRVLDDLDPFAAPYTLEVSSPGLERKLRRPRHYQSAIGRELKVNTQTPVAGDRSHSGVLRAADDSGFTIELADGEERVIEYTAVARARTVFEWNKPARPGARP